MDGVEAVAPRSLRIRRPRSTSDAAVTGLSTAISELLVRVWRIMSSLSSMLILSLDAPAAVMMGATAQVTSMTTIVALSITSDNMPMR